MINSERGLVMEKEGRKVVVLTPQGEWRAVYLRSGKIPEVGEEIMLPPEKKKKPWKALSAAAAVILLLFLTVPLVSQVMVPVTGGELAYYVNIDINPSIELAVDTGERVIDSRAINNDGEQLLAGLKLEGEKLTQAIKIITREAVRRGYYTHDKTGAMVVTVVPAESGEGEQLAAVEAVGEKITKEVKKGLHQMKVRAVVKAITVQPEVREHAVEAGLSTGKYSIMLEALEEGIPVTASDLRQNTIRGALEKYNSDWEQLLKKMQEDKDLLKKERKLGQLLQKAIDKDVLKTGNEDGINKKGNEKEEELEPGNTGRGEEKSKHFNSNGKKENAGVNIQPVIQPVNKKKDFEQDKGQKTEKIEEILEEKKKINDNKSSTGSKGFNDIAESDPVPGLLPGKGTDIQKPGGNPAQASGNDNSSDYFGDREINKGGSVVEKDEKNDNTNPGSGKAGNSGRDKK